MRRSWIGFSLLLSVELIGLGCGLPVGPTNPNLAADELSQQMCVGISETSVDTIGAEPCCAVPLFASDRECGKVVRPHLNASVSAAQEADLVFSADCADRMLDAKECSISSSGSFLACEDDCQLFHGAQPLGSPCVAVGHRMSDCEQGLVCGADRVCRDPCDLIFVAPESGFCGPARGMWFVTCDVGLACGDDGTCEVAQPLGSPCDSTTPCAVGGWCDASTGSCVADLAGGDSCTTDEQCGSKLCRNGSCVEPESDECARWGW